MCNHYKQHIMKGIAIPGWSQEPFSETRIPMRLHNAQPDVWPDYEAAIVRLDDGAPVMEAMRWGFPPPPFAKPPLPVTNLRHPEKAYWKPFLGVEHRCIVPAESFSEPDPEKPKPRAERWFARADGAPLFLAGVWRVFEGERGPKKAPVPGPHRVFTFLTTEPNAIVAPIHPKAMPVILAPADVQAWLSAPPAEALKLQRPAPDDAIVLLDRES